MRAIIGCSGAAVVLGGLLHAAAAAPPERETGVMSRRAVTGQPREAQPSSGSSEEPRRRKRGADRKRHGPHRRPERAKARKTDASLIRVMTFNILYDTSRGAAGPWLRRRPLVAAAIRRWDPDIVGLQEATDLQLEHLAADLPEYGIIPGPISGPSLVPLVAITFSPATATAAWLIHRRERRRAAEEGRRPRRGARVLAGALAGAAAMPVAGAGTAQVAGGGATTQGEYCPILYRRESWRPAATDAFWLSPRPEQPGSTLAGAWLPRVVNRAHLEHRTLNAALDIYNAHLGYLPWEAVRQARVLRRRMDEEWDGTPQLVMGDMNAPDGSAAFRALAGPGDTPDDPPAFHDAWTMAQHREGPRETLHGGTGRGRWPGRIDHILLRPAVHVERAVTIIDRHGEIYPSDHYPVLAEIEPRLGK